MSENGIREAEQRVREMNRMTRQYSEQGNRYLQNIRTPQTSVNVQQSARFEPAAQKQNVPRGQDNSVQNSAPQAFSQNTQRNNSNNIYKQEIHKSGAIFPDLKFDNEKLMILLLMYLLMRENADIKLILALGYLLL